MMSVGLQSKIPCNYTVLGVICSPHVKWPRLHRRVAYLLLLCYGVSYDILFGVYLHVNQDNSASKIDYAPL